MDDTIKNLKGSESRDLFKQWHKTLPNSFYACDIDFMLINKNPPGVVAILDYKQIGDTVTFSEVIGYNDFIKRGYSVYILWGSLNPMKLQVYRYLGGDYKPNPPTVNKKLICVINNKQEFTKWENDLRINFKG